MSFLSSVLYDVGTLGKLSVVSYDESTCPKLLIYSEGGIGISIMALNSQRRSGFSALKEEF